MKTVMIFASENPNSVKRRPTPVEAISSISVMRESFHVGRICFVRLSFWVCRFISAEESGMI